MLTDNHDRSLVVPRLRRYTRALTGDARFGALLYQQAMAMQSAPEDHSDGHTATLAQYGVVSSLWRAFGKVDVSDKCASGEQRRVARMSPAAREAFLLTAMEGFTLREAARIADKTEVEMAALVVAAVEQAGHADSASVVIIEDEFLIAKELEQIVTGLGHRVVGRARTRAAARDLIATEKPTLILADIQLADDSSGIDAVNDVLNELGGTPVIFITAFPARLICAHRPAPTFLVSKPYAPAQVRVAITLNLYFGARSALNPSREEECGPPLVRFG
ncbi:MAG: response regulator [Hyphomicrobiaceae bacterium]|nr:response regulator [Hyphomicrobiaceae bacterium]